MAPSSRWIRSGPGLVVAALVAVGFVLRLRLLHQGFWADELLAYRDIHGKSFRAMLRLVGEGAENSPPVYFVLAWLSSKLGGDLALLRLPSLVLGTGAIPLVYLLGARTVGRWPAVVAAGFIALSPFTIHYSVEARPYAALLFLSALSALALLVALERGDTVGWGAWGLTLAAALYTHYTGFAVVAVEVLWGIWARPRARRDLLLAAAIAAVAFMPWLPFVKGERLDVYRQIATTLGITYPDAAVTWLVGLPFLRPAEMPGTAALALIAGALAIAVVAGPRPKLTREALRGPGALVAALALATPVALLAYSLLAHDLFRFPRNLTASLPFAALVLGWLLLRPGLPRAVVPLALASAGLGIGTVKGELDRYSRPDFPEAAAFIDSVAGRSDSVVYSGSGTDGYDLATCLRMYLTRTHPSFFTADPRRWAGTRRSRRVVVVGASPIGRPPPESPPAPGLVKVRERRFPGMSSLVVALYRSE